MKYFVTSDTHSFLSELKLALKEAGYDKRNKEHVFVLCGDLLDRGPESAKIIKFVRSIPKKRRILIRGNHEELFCSLVRRRQAYRYDVSNRTLNSILNMNSFPSTDEDIQHYLRDDFDGLMSMLEDCFNSDITKEYVEWINSKDWVDWYDLDTPKEKFTFVHSFIPLRKTYGFGLLSSEVTPKMCEYNPNWRNDCTQDERDDARWGKPFAFYDAGLFKEDRTLVCGHWHVGANDYTNSFRAHYFNNVNHDSDKYFEERLLAVRNNDVFRGHGIIGLDACTALSGQVNVMVIDEEGNTYQHNRLLEKENDAPVKD